MNRKEVNNLIADALEKVWQSDTRQTHIKQIAKQLRKGEEWPQYWWDPGRKWWWKMKSESEGVILEWRREVRYEDAETPYEHDSANTATQLDASMATIPEAEADYLARKFTVPDGWEIGELALPMEGEYYKGAYISGRCRAGMDIKEGDFLEGYRWLLRRKVCSECGRSCSCAKGTPND